MKTITQQQMDNLVYARDMWAAIPTYKVSDNLRFWNRELACGSVACFGGHVALDKYFQNQNVYPKSGSGAPGITGGGYLDPWEISQHLFGWDLFEMRARPLGNIDIYHGAQENWSDHELVTHRIAYALMNSKV